MIVHNLGKFLSHRDVKVRTCWHYHALIRHTYLWYVVRDFVGWYSHLLLGTCAKCSVGKQHGTGWPHLVREVGENVSWHGQIIAWFGIGFVTVWWCFRFIKQLNLGSFERNQLFWMVFISLAIVGKSVWNVLDWGGDAYTASLHRCNFW